MTISCFMFIGIYVSVSFFTTSNAADAITQSQTLRDGKTLVSKHGSFQLGFFSPTAGDTKNRFLGIWCKNSSVSSATTVTWVANQHNPINGSSGLLMINSSGNVVLLSQNSTVVWSIALSKQPQNPILQLLDSGNLVLREPRDGNSRNYLWQSLQWDEKAGLYRSLLASSSSDVCDNYGRCGPYGMCDISNSEVCSCLKGFQPKDPGNWNYADNSGGCERITPFVCQNGDGFKKYGGVKLPDTTHSWVNQSMSLKECRASCLNNCSCTAYAISNVKGVSSCTKWFGDLISLRKLLDEGQDLYVRMPASESDTDRPRKTKIIVIAVAAVSIVSGAFLAVYCIHRRRRKRKEKLRNDGMMGQNNEGQKEDLELPSFSLPTLITATDNFSFNMKLGEGGFGSVYKGRLVDGQEIAVKRLSQSSRQGIAEFKNEVILIAKLQHRNLVKLLGYCIQGEERLLIYEYMPNKSLDSYIFDQTQGRLLDWSQRFHIICGIARGLLYLHQDSRLRIIHRDLKASNVLLDKEMNPKISDFGMARIFGGDQTEGVTKKVVGTYGYMAPEYAIDGQFSVKSDVFSFGVLLLETLSGKRSRGFYDRNHNLNLIGHAWRLWKEGRSLEMIDKCLSDSCTLSEVLRCVHVSLLCVQQLPEDRPTMSTVVLMLGGESDLPQPKKPAFFLGKHPSSEAGSSSSKNQTSSTFGVRNETSSTNESSITVLLPR
ncbi:PREDICTED: G-type lectin S-receptor-like serine/threonine-protein kinase At4g27290 isoform X1 [Prunus mume]|uniref:Receptor-like serine/threonine-protein kinase n=1 Tax=Prunus mume TaxID=102107 RepID=A0ABM1LN43_PRUMU|nr:PREDICTED: G-type lectin S-receptor-like serine/threonine-protein kinase At4g27290 isoform X1 [Prunus mume]